MKKVTCSFVILLLTTIQDVYSLFRVSISASFKVVIILLSIVFFQNGLHLLAIKLTLECLVHLMLLILSRDLNHLEWSLWMCLFIHVVTLHWDALVVIALYLQCVLTMNLPLHNKRMPAQSALGLWRLELILYRLIAFLLTIYWSIGGCRFCYVN